MAMWLQIVALVHFSFQATSYARSLDTSLVLDRLISSSIRNHHPVIIIVKPPKSFLPDFKNDETTNTNEYENENVIQLIPSLRSHNHNVESCKQFLRQKLNAKCSNEANCSEVVWDIADQICEDAEDEKETVDEDAVQIKLDKEGSVESRSTPGKSRTSTRLPSITRPQENH